MATMLTLNRSFRHAIPHAALLRVWKSVRRRDT